MQLYQIINNGNRYCGPAVVAALGGIGTKEAATLIRTHSGKACVKGTTHQVMKATLSALGFGLEQQRYAPASKVNFLRWSKLYSRKGETYLVLAGRHWMLVQGGYALCGISKDLVPVGSHPKARAFVEIAYRITQNRIVDAQRLVKNVPMSEALAKRRAEVLAKSHGISLEQDEEDGAIWIDPPKTIQDHIVDGHNVDFWVDALERVKEYVARAKATTGATTEKLALAA